MKSMARSARILPDYVGERAIHSTPAIRHFLERADVTEIVFPSGGVWVFIGRTCGFYATNRLEAIEAAMMAARSTEYDRS